MTSYRARLLHALSSVSNDGKTVTIAAALDVLVSLFDEIVREIVADTYREHSD